MGPKGLHKALRLIFTVDEIYGLVCEIDPSPQIGAIHLEKEHSHIQR